MQDAFLLLDETQKPKPVLFGCAGTKLSLEERALFKKANPFGFILFKRNCEDPDQLRYLIFELQQAVGRSDIQIAIDQEGGRVARLTPPHWPQYPPARAFGRMYEHEIEWGLEAICLFARVLAHQLGTLGITINCAPVIDLFNAEGNPAIGDRAFSGSPETVAALARAEAETFLANGILPVIKHLPGHGKMTVDPHKVLPVIAASRLELEANDFLPVQNLKDMPLGMNSHAIFKSFDPDRPASLSPVMNNDVIRGALGFEGLLLSDDINMKALKGAPEELALQALEAGNDIVLHCDGDLKGMQAIAEALPPLSEASWNRWLAAQARAKPRDLSYAPEKDAARLDILLGGLAFEEDAAECKISCA